MTLIYESKRMTLSTMKMDDNIFLQVLGGVKENSLKDKIETANPENEYLNIIKHSSL